MTQIAPMSVGRVDMRYRRVDCTPPLPVSVAIDNNAGVGGWLRLVVEVCRWHSQKCKPCTRPNSKGLLSFLTLAWHDRQVKHECLDDSEIQTPMRQGQYVNVSPVLQKTAGFGGITAVSIRNTGATWAAMTNKFGSAWEVSNTPQLPWDFQFTSDSGQSVSFVTYLFI